MMRAHNGVRPVLGDACVVLPGGVLVGDVQLGSHCSVWYNAVLRGDVNRVRIGDWCNIQDGAVLHVGDRHGLQIGHRVSIGHGAVVHGCTLGNEVLVGINATILDGAVIGEGCIVGAGALVPEGMQVPAGSLVIGLPGKVVRVVRPDERDYIASLATRYHALALAQQQD